MKKTMLMFGAALALCTVACNETSSTKEAVQDSVDKQADKKEEINETKTDDKTAEFVVEAAGSGMMEIKAGELAQKNASSKKVKDFGAMMVKDHTAASDELKALASAKGWQLPTALVEKHQKHIDELAKKTGTEFDKDYIDMMVDGHENVVKEFEKAGEDSKDADLKAWVAKTLPTIRKHLDEAKAIKETQKKM